MELFLKAKCPEDALECDCARDFVRGVRRPKMRVQTKENDLGRCHVGFQSESSHSLQCVIRMCVNYSKRSFNYGDFMRVSMHYLITIIQVTLIGGFADPFLKGLGFLLQFKQSNQSNCVHAQKISFGSSVEYFSYT